MSETPAPSGDVTQSLARGLAVIRAFGPSQPELTLSDVAAATGLTRATARRCLLTLVELGYVRQKDRHFALRPKVLELGYSYLSSLSIPELALPHLEKLAESVHEACSLAVLDDDDVVYAARVTTKRIMTLSINVGTRFPAYATSMGRVLLAAQPTEWLEDYLSRTELTPFTDRSVTDPAQFRGLLDRARTQRYSLSDEELERGIRSLAVPVRGADGDVIAAMNVAMASRGTSIDGLIEEFLPELQSCAAALESDLVARYGQPQG